VYIGSTQKYEQRWQQHICNLSSNTHCNDNLQADWNKYGKDNFEFSILQEVSLENQFTSEQYYIDQIKPFGNIGYNISKKSCRKVVKCKDKVKLTFSLENSVLDWLNQRVIEEDRNKGRIVERLLKEYRNKLESDNKAD